MFGGIWSYVLALALACGFIGGVYQTGYNSALRRSEVADITAERDAARRDLETARRLAELSRFQSDELASEARANEAKIKAMTNALKDRNRCRLGDFAGKLQSIR